MSLNKSQDNLLESERILRQFLEDLEEQTKKNPSAGGRKSDFNHNLVKVPSSVKQTDPKTGNLKHIITKDQVPLFYEVVNSEEGYEDESSKPEDNWSNFRPYSASDDRISVRSRTKSQESWKSANEEVMFFRGSYNGLML